MKDAHISLPKPTAIDTTPERYSLFIMITPSDQYFGKKIKCHYNPKNPYKRNKAMLLKSRYVFPVVQEYSIRSSQKAIVANLMFRKQGQASRAGHRHLPSSTGSTGQDCLIDCFIPQGPRHPKFQKI